MNKRKFLALAVAIAIAGTTMLGVTSATSDYMHYQDGTISICDPSSNGTKCITMQDKNLGASEVGTGVASYGYHFQRGNNHGFLPGENGSDTFPGGESTGLATQVTNCANYGPAPLGRYDSNTFIFMVSDWCNPKNDNLRGGENDTAENNYGFDETDNVATNVANRRGPCGEGYHVPSIGEWNQVLEYWAEENGIELEDDGGLKYNNTTLDGLKFQEDFKIPFAGRRYDYDAKVYSMGSYATLWSSSPYVGFDIARGFYLDPNVADADFINDRANAYSLRCFKDSYLEFPSSEGGSGTAVTETNVILTLTEGSNTCTLNDYNLGTHDTSTVDQNVESSGQEIVCEFLKNSGVKVLLSMENLSDGVKTIGAENFTGVITANGNSLGSIGNLTGGSHNLLGSREIYNKEANTIGKWTGNLQIIGRIPAGTPSGTYTGQLNIVIQEGF